MRNLIQHDYEDDDERYIMEPAPCLDGSGGAEGKGQKGKGKGSVKPETKKKLHGKKNKNVKKQPKSK